MTPKTKHVFSEWVKWVLGILIMFGMAIMTRVWAIQDKQDDRIVALEKSEEGLKKSIEYQSIMLDRIWIEIKETRKTVIGSQYPWESYRY